jgi:hypothetical protein
METEQAIERLSKFPGVDHFLDFSQFINHHSNLQTLNIQVLALFSPSIKVPNTKTAGP